jgi:hypothetical protein
MASTNNPVVFASVRPALFASVRSSRNYGLIAFAGALFAAFALHAGAFLPPLGGGDGGASRPAVAARQAATPAVVAHRPEMPRSSSASQAEPCPAPRG